MPSLRVEIQCRRGRRTSWILLEYPEGQPPVALLADLEAVGWSEDGKREPPPLNGVATLTLAKPGTDLFRAWTAAEQIANLNELQAIMERHGLRARFRELSLTDLL